MTLPAIVLGFVIASLIGSVFHLWRGGSLLRLVMYIVFSWVGFWLGNYVANRFGISFWKIGSLQVGMGILFSLAVVGFGYWLSLVQHMDPTAPTKPGNK